jgi:hypothetical protein
MNRFWAWLLGYSGEYHAGIRSRQHGVSIDAADHYYDREGDPMRWAFWTHGWADEDDRRS